MRSSRTSGVAMIDSALLGRRLTPPLVGAGEVFARIDLHVSAERVDAVKRRTALDHVLKQVDEVRAFEGSSFAPRLAGPRCARRVESIEDFAGALGAHLGNADELAGRLVRRDASREL